MMKEQMADNGNTMGEERVFSSSNPDDRDYLYRCGRNKDEGSIPYV